MTPDKEKRRLSFLSYADILNEERSSPIPLGSQPMSTSSSFSGLGALHGLPGGHVMINGEDEIEELRGRVEAIGQSEGRRR